MDIEKIQKEYHQKVKLCCDEYHAHSINKNCYCGNEKDLLILLLCDKLINIKQRIHTLNRGLDL